MKFPERSQDPESGSHEDQAFARRLERLVDGELSEIERRQTLALCEERSDGWRCCALAFLESQAWRGEISRLASPPLAARTGPQSAAPPPQPRALAPARRRFVAVSSSVDWSRAPASGGVWTLAASALVAFAIGWLARPIAAPSWADVPESPPALPLVQQGAPDDGWYADADAPRDAGALAPQETVTLVMNCGPDQEARQIELPVVASSDDSLAALAQNSPIVPAEVQAALLRIGHRVNERRQLMPLELEDGRQVVVPVDEIEFVPVEAPVYQ